MYLWERNVELCNIYYKYAVMCLLSVVRVTVTYDYTLNTCYAHCIYFVHIPWVFIKYWNNRCEWKMRFPTPSFRVIWEGSPRRQGEGCEQLSPASEKTCFSGRRKHVAKPSPRVSPSLQDFMCLQRSRRQILVGAGLGFLSLGFRASSGALSSPLLLLHFRVSKKKKKEVIRFVLSRCICSSSDLPKLV